MKPLIEQIKDIEKIQAEIIAKQAEQDEILAAILLNQMEV